MLRNYTNKEVPRLHSFSVAILLFIHSFGKYWASKICQASTFQETIQKNLVHLWPPSFWLIRVFSHKHTSALSPPGTGSDWTHKHKPHLAICALLLLYSYELYCLILLTPLVSHHVEVSKHGWTQILTSLKPPVSHSDSTLPSALRSSPLCPLAASTMTTPSSVQPN